MLPGPIRCGRKVEFDVAVDRSGRAMAPRVLPKPVGDRQRIDIDALPPCRLVTVSVQFPVMGTAYRNGELVADLAAECSRLGEPQMVGIGRLAATDQAGLGGYEFTVVLVA